MTNVKKTSYLDGVAFGRSTHIPYVIELAFTNITADPQQPRKHFDQDELQSLAQSILDKGLLQPITVRRDPALDGKYIIVAGERRFRASQLAGLPSIACIVTEGNPREIALVENVQRSDLNPLEEAEAISVLVEEHGYTHETVAKALGKGRTYITETLSFLSLPEAAKTRLRTSNVKWSILRELSKMEEDVREVALEKIESGAGLTVKEAGALKKRKEATPVKLAVNAIYATITRLEQLEGKPKSDEIKVLREAKNKLDAAYKEAVRPLANQEGL